MRNKLMRLRNAIAAAGLGLLAACASYPTPYQQALTENGQGFTTQRIESNRYRISFKGNSVTSRQRVDSYMLYRYAEVTLENGYDYFVVVSRDTDKSTAYETMNDGFGFSYGMGWGGPSGWGGPWAGPSFDYSRPINSYDAIADIKLFKGAKPFDDPHAYDAHEVMNSLAPTIMTAPQPAPRPQ